MIAVYNHPRGMHKFKDDYDTYIERCSTQFVDSLIKNGKTFMKLPNYTIATDIKIKVYEKLKERRKKYKYKVEVIVMGTFGAPMNLRGWSITKKDTEEEFSSTVAHLRRYGNTILADDLVWHYGTVTCKRLLSKYLGCDVRVSERKQLDFNTYVVEIK